MKDTERKFSDQLKVGVTAGPRAALELASERQCSTLSATARRYWVNGLRADGIDPTTAETTA